MDRASINNYDRQKKIPVRMSGFERVERDQHNRVGKKGIKGCGGLCVKELGLQIYREVRRFA